MDVLKYCIINNININLAKLISAYFYGIRYLNTNYKKVKESKTQNSGQLILSNCNNLLQFKSEYISTNVNKYQVSITNKKIPMVLTSISLQKIRLKNVFVIYSECYLKHSFTLKDCEYYFYITKNNEFKIEKNIKQHEFLNNNNNRITKIFFILLIQL